MWSIFVFLRTGLAVILDQTTFEEAAVLPIGGLEAVHFLKEANFQSGEKVSLDGVCGPVWLT